MHRRDFLAKVLAAGSAASVSTLASTGHAENFLWQVLAFPSARSSDNLIGQIHSIVANANSAFTGLVHGYGLAAHELLEKNEEPLPLIPKRSHPSWPYIHCVCHCVGTASLGEDGLRWSQWAGISDEVSQQYWANVFRTQIYPRIYADLHLRPRSDNPDRDLQLVMQYLFGTEKSARKSLTLIAANSSDSKRKVLDLKQMLAPLIDSCESAWQRSDFLDNAVGRAGGCECPGDLPLAGRVGFCRKWCKCHGIASDTGEGPGTERPWGPYHPLHPGPAPTEQEVMFGNLLPDLGASFQRPHSMYEPPPDLIVPDLSRKILALRASEN